MVVVAATLSPGRVAECMSRPPTPAVSSQQASHWRCLEGATLVKLGQHHIWIYLSLQPTPVVQHHGRGGEVLLHAPKAQRHGGEGAVLLRCDLTLSVGGLECRLDHSDMAFGEAAGRGDAEGAAWPGL